MSWIKKLMPGAIRTETGAPRKRNVPEGLWEKCDRCGAVLYRPELEQNLEVCPKCNAHRPIRARARLRGFLDPDAGPEIGAALGPTDVLRFRDQTRPASHSQRPDKGVLTRSPSAVAAPGASCREP